MMRTRIISMVAELLVSTSYYIRLHCMFIVIVAHYREQLKLSYAYF